MMKNWRRVELVVTLLVCILGCVKGATDPNDDRFACADFFDTSAFLVPLFLFLFFVASSSLFGFVAAAYDIRTTKDTAFDAFPDFAFLV
ncbi:hypothetical protein DKX38_001274 [Salix brachista]|uniref:CASP-like protein n=1 Tax=Salix brachista TaxID=2182728 RepID=A0A5N5P2P9_9ROSI|nr:hypothetical protein DKX38_001274 [Salix brachista]